MVAETGLNDGVSGHGCDEKVEFHAIKGLPVVQPGDDLSELLVSEMLACGLAARNSDVLVVASKLVSRAEGRFVNLAGLRVSAEAEELAAEVQKDPRLVELILQESVHISRRCPGVLIVRHRLGHISANAGIDASNVGPRNPEGEWVLLLPKNPDGVAAEIRHRLRESFGVDVGVIIADSLGRPFRLGTVGHAIGVSGVPALWDQRGQEDLFERSLELTETARAVQVAASADLVLGQGSEGRGAVLVRGVRFPMVESAAVDLLRDEGRDLYAREGGGHVNAL